MTPPAPRRKRSARQIAGYLVTWRGEPMGTSARSSLRRDEVGRLFAGRATLWPTRTQARTAMRRSIAAWGRSDAQRWHVVTVYRPHPEAPPRG